MGGRVNRGVLGLVLRIFLSWCSRKNLVAFITYLLIKVGVYFIE